MWMLVRDGAITREESQAAHTLAACPDSAERGDEWRWSVSRVDDGGDWTVRVDADDQHVTVDHTVLRAPGEWELLRRSGEEIVVVARKGRHLVQDSTGPWRRWLDPGDVFVVEGEAPEHLVLTASEASEASVVRLSSRDAQALRWVP